VRIVIITGSLAHGGAEHHAIALANGLAARGHECHFVHVKPPSDQATRLDLAGCGTIRCLNATAYLDRHAIARLASAIAWIRPTVIVAANPYALMYAALACAMSGCRVPTVVIYHSTRWPGVKEQSKLLAYRPLMWSADCAVFVCEYQRRYCLRRGLLSRRNVVIHNGVDTARFLDHCDETTRRAHRAALGFAASDFVIALPAALRPEKNHAQLVDAVAELSATGVEAHALCIGDGPERAALEAHARERRISDRLVITGFRDDVRPFLAASDVVAICSVTEALSIAAIEAMAMARAIVHSEVGGAAELIDHGCSGLLFPVGDTGRLVQCLRRLTDFPAAAAMGAMARRTIETRFTVETMVERYEQLLLGISTTGRPPLAGRQVPTAHASS
jgi:glycosyltransferase involved in cell wall biosynthesis